MDDRRPGAVRGRPLSGYRVLDLTQYISGPSGTLLMAEMGAEVIKVEFASMGDPTRQTPFVRDQRSTYFVQHNRGKKSVCLDLKTDEGRAIVKDLVVQSDVFVQNFTPGVVERMGLGYEDLRLLNSRLIMCSISAFGPVGPLAQAPGFDSCGGAYAGTLSMIGPKDGPPTKPQLAIGDITTGMNAFSAVLCALLERERTGEGQLIDVSLLDSWFFLHESAPAHLTVKGSALKPTRTGGGAAYAAPTGTYKGVEKYFVLQAPYDGQFARLCDAMGAPGLMQDERFSTAPARVKNHDALKDVIERWMSSMSSDEHIIATLKSHAVPCAPILSVEEAVRHPHLRLRGTVRSINDRILGDFDVPGVPFRISGVTSQDLPAPLLGEHNTEVLSDVLDYSETEIRELSERGVLCQGNF